MKTVTSCLLALTMLAGCGDQGNAAAEAVAATASAGAAGSSTRSASSAPFVITPMATFDEPWALTFLPDGRLLVTEKRGRLKLLKPGGASIEVSGVPGVDYGGQGGLGDVLVHPRFANNGWVYLSYAEAGEGNVRGAAVARARLAIGENKAALSDLKVIWRQVPKVSGQGHYGHRLAFGSDGKLWISSGDRQKFDPAQDLRSNLGKIIRLNDDGSVPPDNPFASRGGVTAQIWSLGHRNPLGIAFDAAQRLWIHEMGPRGGDEINLIVRGRNYGWPEVSNGDNYDGSDIPDHSTSAIYEAPKTSWTPVIAPAGFIIYTGTEFPEWNGAGLIGGLASEALVRVELGADTARETARYPMGKRIREVEQAPDGAVYLLEDGSDARLLRLMHN